MTKPITPKGLDHVVIRTGRIDAMIGFYETVVGCSVERSVETLGLYQLRAGASLIDLVDTNGEIGKSGGPAPGDDSLNMDHFCLRIEPWDEAVIREHLTLHKIKAPETADRYGADGTGPSIYIQDPDGNTVELKGPPSDA